MNLNNKNMPIISIKIRNHTQNIISIESVYVIVLYFSLNDVKMSETLVNYEI